MEEVTKETLTSVVCRMQFVSKTKLQLKKIEKLIKEICNEKMIN